jgi:histidyl-tRNA synthetase
MIRKQTMIQSLRGFRDILYPESKKYTDFENIARKVMDAFGYKEIRIPTLEQKELFVKSTGETTDIVSKEMYAFEDAGGRNIALRPEATPGIIRAYLERNLHKTHPLQKLYCIGNMFRAERPQKGRYRQFEQIDVEIIGNPHPSADAEVILLLDNIFKKAKVQDYTIEINSLGCAKCRPLYRKNLLDFLNANKKDLCRNCIERIEKNPLRVLDCKIDKPKIINSIAKLKLCADCEKHFENVQLLLNNLKIDCRADPYMVRGLDYYTRTVFEFKSTELGAQDALAGGGRYDDLVKSLGGPDTPATGWAMGVDRVLQSIKQKTIPDKPLSFVISADEKSQITAFSIMHELQDNGLKTDGGIFAQSLKSQMRAAGKSGAKFAIIIGERELKNNTVTVRDLKIGKQQEIKREKLQGFLKEQSKSPPLTKGD